MVAARYLTPAGEQVAIDYSGWTEALDRAGIGDVLTCWFRSDDPSRVTFRGGVDVASLVFAALFLLGGLGLGWYAIRGRLIPRTVGNRDRGK